jgi:hypothetical protein
MKFIDSRRPVLNRLTLLIATGLSAGPAVPVQAASSFASASATVYPPPTSVMDSLAAMPVTIVSATGAVVLRIIPATPLAEPTSAASTAGGTAIGGAEGPRAVAMVNPGTPGEASPVTLTDFNRLVGDGGTLRGGLVGSMSVQAPPAGAGVAGNADFHVTVAFN